MAKKKSKQPKVNRSRPISKQQLKAAQNKAIDAKEKIDMLMEDEKQQLRGKDQHSAAIISEQFEKEIVEFEREITTYNQLCMEINSKKPDRAAVKMGKKRNNSSWTTPSNRPFSTKLKKAENNVSKAKEKLINLLKARAQQGKGKDTTPLGSKITEKEIADAERELGRCDHVCKKVKAKITKHEAKLQRPQQVSTGANRVQSSKSLMSILCWKTDLRGKALHDKLQQSNADMILLQGTQLNITAVPDGYKVFQKHAMNGAIVLRRCIEAKEINNQCREMQVQSILITHTRTPFVLSNVMDTITSEADLMKLGQINDNHLIAGDFGALHIRYNCKTTNQAGEMVQKFRVKYSYGISNGWLTKDQVASGGPQKHHFFLISPQLHPHLSPSHHQTFGGDGILFTCSVSLAAPESPANNHPVAHKHKLTRMVKMQLRKEFANSQTEETGEEGPKLPQDLLSRLSGAHTEGDDSLLPNCQRYWRFLASQKGRSLVHTRSLRKPRPPKGDQSQPVIPAEEMALMAHGIVTEISSITSGWLFAEDYGSVRIPSEAVASRDSLFKTLEMHLLVGDRVRFLADRIASSDCGWRANQVVLDPSPVADLSGVIINKSGTVIELGGGGSYALIESPLHGTVYCPSSALNASGVDVLISRVDHLLQMGDNVQFSAHLYPSNTHGMDWLAFSATKLEQQIDAQLLNGQTQKISLQPQEENHCKAKETLQAQGRKQKQPHLLSEIPNAIGEQQIKEEPQDFVQSADVVASQKRSRKKRKAPIVIEIPDDVIPEKQIKPEPLDSVPDPVPPPVAQHKDIAVKQMKKEPVDSFSSQPTHSPTVSVQANSDKKTFQQRGLNEGKQTTGDLVPRTWQTTIINDKGAVMDLAIDHAVVETDKFGVVTCPLSKLINNGMAKSTSLLDVFNNGDRVMVTAARNTPTQPWSVLGFHKTS